MSLRPAETFTLTHGDTTVQMRASLRAAMILERAFDGFAPLFRQIGESHLGAFRQVILATATDHGDAVRLLKETGSLPLSSFFAAAREPVEAVCATLLPTPEPEAAGSRTDTTPKPWNEFFAELYRVGTGWLGWSAADTWDATPSEIIEAFTGWTEMQKALHPAIDEDGDDRSTPSSKEREAQRQANIEAGLDPDFDRAALHALKAKLGA